MSQRCLCVETDFRWLPENVSGFGGGGGSELGHKERTMSQVFFGAKHNLPLLRPGANALFEYLYYGSTDNIKYFNSFCAEICYRCRNRTYKDAPELKGLTSNTDFNYNMIPLLTLSILNFSFSSSSTTSRKLLSQFSTCSA